MKTWYSNLTRPPLTPPDWIFGPVWTVLYILIAISIYLFVRKTLPYRPYTLYALTALHLAANFAWTPLFFGRQNIGLALLDIILIDITLLIMVFVFWRFSKLASVLLWPYLIWVLFATYLNAGFLFLNKEL